VQTDPVDPRGVWARRYGGVHREHQRPLLPHLDVDPSGQQIPGHPLVDLTLVERLVERPPPPHPDRLQGQLGHRPDRPVRPGQRVHHLEQPVRAATETVVGLTPEPGQPSQGPVTPDHRQLVHNLLRGCLC
jgi:hypothetical protein